MSKRILFAVLLLVLVFALSGVAFAWQGRMGGMGDPFGLVQDESDYLIHPAKIANGEGVRFYLDYRYLYTGVSEWDNDLNIFTPGGVLTTIFNKDGSGNEQRNDVLGGSAFPVGPGRMGLFFSYSGMRGITNGTQPEWYPPAPPPYFDTYQLDSKSDNFAFRLLYGLPLGAFKLGAEAQLAYRQEENKELYNEDFGAGVRWLWTNYPYGGMSNYHDLFFFMLPYDSKYWEALFKGSLEGKIGPLDLEVTLRAGFPFSSDNTLKFDQETPIGTLAGGYRLKGEVEGWRVGGDFWVRYLLAPDLSLPFLVRADYEDKTRDGKGAGALNLTGDYFTYKSQEQNLAITVGGGLDKVFAKGARIAGGLYYNYLQGTNDFRLMEYYTGGSLSDDHSDFPTSTEHQIMLKLAGELPLSSAITLRMGLAPFVGWVNEDFKYNFTQTTPVYFDKISLNGYDWGIGASVGGTIKFKPITLEPFINGGWQQLHVHGNGNRTMGSGVLDMLFDMETDRNQWSIGGGLSILYDL